MKNYRIIVTKKKIENFNEDVLVVYTEYDYEESKTKKLGTIRELEDVRIAHYDDCYVCFLAEYIENNYGFTGDLKSLSIKIKTEDFECECCGSYYDTIITFKAFGETFESYEDGHFGNDKKFDLKEIEECFRKNGYHVKFDI